MIGLSGDPIWHGIRQARGSERLDLATNDLYDLRCFGELRGRHRKGHADKIVPGTHQRAIIAGAELLYVGETAPYRRARFEPLLVALFFEPLQATVAQPTFSSSCALLRCTVIWRG